MNKFECVRKPTPANQYALFSDGDEPAGFPIPAPVTRQDLDAALENARKRLGPKIEAAAAKIVACLENADARGYDDSAIAEALAVLMGSAGLPCSLGRASALVTAWRTSKAD